jgi:NADH:ubiquinone reductase (H+-translocating)
MDQTKRRKVVIVGAGFGGLWAARTLANHNVDVTVVDRNNYHTFLALLYQVAAAELEAEDIAYPVRSVLWDFPNVDFVLGDVRCIDQEKRILVTDGEAIAYDYLILAAGSVTHTFGIPGAETHAYGLKTLDEAVALKNHIIFCFEKAAREADESRRKNLLTFAIVGGGATGVEYAGALSELIHGPLVRDYPTIDFRDVHIVLLEASDRLIAAMPDPVRTYAREKLRKMGVDVRLGAKVMKVTADKVILEGQHIIPAETVVWTSGVRGDPVATSSGLTAEGDTRVNVLRTLQVDGRPEIYVIGDLASIRESGRILPMVAQVAIQSGIAAARNILLQIAGDAPQPFRYVDRGSMITIGRNAAGVEIGGKTFTGFIAWILWLFIHLFNLIGFRNRVMVLINWAWDYLFYERAVRFIFPHGMASPRPFPSHNVQKVPPTGREGK